jgi:hypothetical protein
MRHSAALVGAGCCSVQQGRAGDLPFSTTKLATLKLSEILTVLEENEVNLNEVTWQSCPDSGSTTRLQGSLEAIGDGTKQFLPSELWYSSSGMGLLGLAMGRSILTIDPDWVNYYPIHTVVSPSQFPVPNGSETRVTEITCRRPDSEFWNLEDQASKDRMTATLDFIVACLKEDPNCIILKVGGPGR